MARKTRLRLHLEEELFDLRITPSPRRRDPEHAFKVSRHKLTEAQLAIWRRLFGEASPAEKTRVEKTTVEALLTQCRAGGLYEAELYRERAGTYIEIRTTKHGSTESQRGDLRRVSEKPA